MKKAVFFLFCIGFTQYSYAQSAELLAELRTNKENNLIKFEQYLSKQGGSTASKILNDDKSKLAGFAGKIPIFWTIEDSYGNAVVNMTALQDGTLTGLNSAKIDGKGIEILVMDGGRVFETHDAFKNPDDSSTPRVFNRESATETISDHATNVTGIILGKGATASTYGVLTNAKSVNYLFADTALGNNFQKLATAPNVNISNHSYGVNLGWAKRDASKDGPEGFYWYGNLNLGPEDVYSGSYGDNDASYDKIVYDNNSQIIVKSAGNYFGTAPASADKKLKYNGSTWVEFDASETLPPANCSNGYNCIGYGSLAKNVIVVGATNQLAASATTYTSSDQVSKASFSSAGPRKDGAIKPDISAVGVNVNSPRYIKDSPTTTTSYIRGGGTSYSAPVIAGITGALTQVQRVLLNNAAFAFKADEMKVLLTHTANEAGNIGPDVWFGWGLADASKAATLLIDKKTSKVTFERNNLSTGAKYSKEVIAVDGQPLKASISWVDPAATPFTTDEDEKNNHTSRLVNDLDLKITEVSTGTVYYPWKLDINNPMAPATKGDNTVDNVEQVLIESPKAGAKYLVEITSKGTLVNSNLQPVTQDYALIITGYDATAGTSNVDLNKLITVYPAVTKDIVTLVIPVKATDINVFDMTGKNVINTNAKNSQTLDFTNLANGVYIINIKTEKGTVSKKVIKK